MLRAVPLAVLLIASVAGCGGAPSGGFSKERPPAPSEVDSGGASDASSAKLDTGGTADTGTMPDTGSPVDGGLNAGALYPIPDWTLGNPADVGIDPAGLETAAGVAASDGSYCLLVIRHGLLVFERYWNGTDAYTPNSSWSIAKSYSSTLVGIALDRGDLRSLDEPAADFVPEWRSDGRSAITLRNLVSMTSGLQWNAFQDYVQMATFASDDTAFAVGVPLASMPGSSWTYDNAAVQVLERVFENATGLTLEQYAEEHLWSRLGMRATWRKDPSGHPTAYANVLASCRDHARFGYLYLHHGTWADGQVVSTAYVNEALTPSQPMNRAYGLLFWLNAGTPAEDAMMEPWPGLMVPFAPTDLFAARGFGNQFIDVIPSLDLIVVRFGPDPFANGFDLAALLVDSKFQTHDQILAPVLDAVH